MTMIPRASRARHETAKEAVRQQAAECDAVGRRKLRMALQSPWSCV